MTRKYGEGALTCEGAAADERMWPGAGVLRREQGQGPGAVEAPRDIRCKRLAAGGCCSLLAAEAAGDSGFSPHGKLLRVNLTQRA